jgi:hypothetical protein
MPSLHFGWDLLLGWAIIWAFWGQRWLWLAVPIGIFLPVSQFFSITMTGNHYFLDAVAGGVVALMGLAVALSLARWFYPRLNAWARTLPSPALRSWIIPPDEATSLQVSEVEIGD